MIKRIVSIAFISGFMLSASSAQATPPGGTNISSGIFQNSSTTIPKPPTFKSTEVNNGVKKLYHLFKKYAPAVRSKDKDKVRQLANKIKGMKKEIAQWKEKMSPKEKQEFQDYMRKLQATLSSK